MSTVNFLLFANPNHIICCGSISPKECSRLTLLFWGWNMNNMHTIPDQKITVDQNKEFLHHITTYRKVVINTYQLQNQAKDQFDNQNEDSIQYSLLKDYPMAKLLAFHSFCLDLEELYVIYCVEQPRCINQYYNTMQPTKTTVHSTASAYLEEPNWEIKPTFVCVFVSCSFYFYHVASKLP